MYIHIYSRLQASGRPGRRYSHMHVKNHLDKDAWSKAPWSKRRVGRRDKSYVLAALPVCASAREIVDEKVAPAIG